MYNKSMKQSKVILLVTFGLFFLVCSGCFSSSKINLGTYTWNCSWCKDSMKSRYEYVKNVDGGWNFKRDGSYMTHTSPMARHEAYGDRMRHVRRFPARTSVKHDGHLFCSAFSQEYCQYVAMPIWPLECKVLKT